MSEDPFWNDRRTGAHRQENQRGPRAFVRALVKVPTGVPAWLWYTGLTIGALGACVALGGLVGATIALTNEWFQ